MPQNLNQAQEYAEKWLGIIKKPEQPQEALGKWIIEESMQNFAEYFNRGWLEYQKSVTQAGQWAATEWTGHGAIFEDVLGRKTVDARQLGIPLVITSGSSDLDGFQLNDRELITTRKVISFMVTITRWNMDFSGNTLQRSIRCVHSGGIKQQSQ